MSVSHISYSDLRRMWERSKTLMDIAAMETHDPKYRKIFENLEESVEILSSIIIAKGDLEFALEQDGVVNGVSTTYHFDLTEKEIAGIKNFGWPNP